MLLWQYIILYNTFWKWINYRLWINLNILVICSLSDFSNPFMITIFIWLYFILYHYFQKWINYSLRITFNSIVICSLSGFSKPFTNKILTWQYNNFGHAYLKAYININFFDINIALHITFTFTSDKYQHHVFFLL